MLLISTSLQPVARYWPLLPTSIEKAHGMALHMRVEPSAMVTTSGLPVFKSLTPRPAIAWPFALRRSKRKRSLPRCSHEKSRKEKLRVLRSEVKVWETAFGFGFWLSETLFGVPNPSILVHLKGVAVTPPISEYVGNCVGSSA